MTTIYAVRQQTGRWPPYTVSLHATRSGASKVARNLTRGWVKSLGGEAWKLNKAVWAWTAPPHSAAGTTTITIETRTLYR